MTNQKINHNLSEAQEYYLGLFRKWQKWQETEPQKLPEGYRSKGEFDFNILSKIFVEEIFYDELENKYCLRTDRFHRKMTSPDFDLISTMLNNQVLDFDYKMDLYYVSHLTILADCCESHFTFKYIHFEGKQLSPISLEILLKNLISGKFELDKSSTVDNEIILRLNVFNRDSKITDLQNELNPIKILKEQFKEDRLAQSQNPNIIINGNSGQIQMGNNNQIQSQNGSNNAQSINNPSQVEKRKSFLEKINIPITLLLLFLGFVLAIAGFVLTNKNETIPIIKFLKPFLGL